MFNRKFLLSALALNLGLVGSASADVLNLGADIDSTIRSSSPDGDNTASSILFVGDTTTAGDFLRSAISFDLNQAELVGATINSVTLTMTVRSARTASADGDIDLELYELSQSFDAGITWNARTGSANWTAPGGDLGSNLVTVAGDPGTAAPNDTFDFSSASLTSSVASANGSSLYLLLKSGSEDNTADNLFIFASNVNTTNGAAGPVLTIDYTPVPEPTSLALLGLGGLCMLRRRRG